MVFQNSTVVVRHIHNLLVPSVLNHTKSLSFFKAAAWVMLSSAIAAVLDPVCEMPDSTIGTTELFWQTPARWGRGLGSSTPDSVKFPPQPGRGHIGLYGAFCRIESIL